MTSGAKPARQVLSGGTVLTMDPQGAVYSPGVVVIERDRIVHVGESGTWRSRDEDLRVDCRGHLLMPGLINTHTHTCMVLFRGLGEDRPRSAWAPNYTLPYQDQMLPEDYYWGTLLGGLEMLSNGITTTADRFSHMETIAEAMQSTGIRAVLCHTLSDIGRAVELDRALALIARWGVSPDRRVHCGLGPHAPDTCSDGLLRRIRAVANDTGARIFIHCAQSEVELAALRSRGYVGAVHCLHANDLLGPDVVAAHCIYVDEKEIRLLAETGTWVAHCPVSNAKTEGRMAPLRDMVRAGVRVCLGTDWAPANNGMDLFDEMKGAGVLNKVTADDPTFMTAPRLLAMATIDGARALGIDAHVGSLEAGKRADIIAIAMDSLHFHPCHSLAATLAYSAKGQDVRHVWVDGHWLIKDRLPTKFDVSLVKGKVREIWHRIKLGVP